MRHDVGFTWIGGPSHLLRLGPFRVLSDPVFARELEMPRGVVERVAEVPDVDLSLVDAVCLSCLRADHFDPSLPERIPGAPIVTPRGSATPRGDAGLAGVRELAWYEEARLEKGGRTLAIIAVPACSKSGDDNGYYFRFSADEGEYTAYCTGDALWSDDIRHIQRELGHVDLLIQHLGAEGGTQSLTSPDAKEAMQFVYRMQPKAIVPVHHSTFSHYTEALEPFARSIGRTIYDRRLRALREGESL